MYLNISLVLNLSLFRYMIVIIYREKENSLYFENFWTRDVLEIRASGIPLEGG